MIKVTENKNLEAELEAHLSEAMGLAADAAAEGLRGRLSYRSMKRTGRKYKKYPRQSSAFGEYPQEQSSDLLESVDSRQADPLVAEVGFNSSDKEKIEYLEWPEKGKAGARRPLPACQRHAPSCPTFRTGTPRTALRDRTR